jgi:hypothetical protein
LNRNKTPTIPEDSLNVPSDKRDVIYRVDDTDDEVPTIDATVEIVGSSSHADIKDASL